MVQGFGLSSGSVSRSSGAVLGVMVIGAGVQFGFHVLLARVLTVAEYGAFSFGFSVYTMLILGNKLAGDNLILRELPSVTGKRHACELRTFLLSVPAILYVVSLAGVWISVQTGAIAKSYVPSVSAFVLILPLGVYLKYALAYCRTEGYYVAAQIGDQVVRPGFAILVLAVLAHVSSIDMLAAIAALATGTMLAIAVTAIPVRKDLWRMIRLPRASLFLPAVRRYLRSAAIMTGISGQNVAIKQMDVLFLGMLTTPALVGSYAAATKIALVATFMLAAVNIVVSPIFSKLYSENRIRELKSVIREGSRLIFVASFAIWILVVLWAEQLLGLFGAEYHNAVLPLQILVSGQLVNALAGPVGTLLNMIHKEHITIRALALALVLAVALNVTLIPLYGQIGAAIAYAAALVAWNFTLAAYCWLKLEINTTVLQA